MKQILKQLIVWGGVLFLSGVLHGASISEEDQQKAQQALDKSLIDNEKRLQYIEDQKNQRDLEAPRVQYQVKELETKEQEDGLVTFKVSEIKLDGAHYLTRYEAAFLTEKYLNTEIDQNKVYALIREVTNYYINKGFITTRVYLPKQNFNTGRLTLGVDEGYIEDIVFGEGGSTQPHRLSLWTAFPNMVGRRLNLRDIEQGLDQLNRLSSNQAKMRLVPSKTKDGYSRVIIDNNQTNPHHASISYDNTKPMTFVPRQTMLSRDNLLSIGDYWGLTYSHDHQGRRRYNNSFSGNMSVPFGYATFSANFSRFNYMVPLDPKYGYSALFGQTDTLNLRAETLLLRGQNTKTSINTTLTTKDTDSFYEDVVNEVGSRKLTIWGIGLTQSWVGPLGIWSFGLHQYQGLPRLGATVDEPDSNETAPKAQFHKTVIDMSVYKHLTVFAMPVTFRSSLRGQYSKQALFNSESLTLGDQYTVRGFRDESLQGESGAYIRNELSTAFSNIMFWKSMKSFFGKNNMTIFGAFDAGYLRAKGGRAANNGHGEGTLMGGAIGLRYYGAQMTFDLTYAQPLYSPEIISSSGREIYFNISYNLLR